MTDTEPYTPSLTEAVEAATWALIDYDTDVADRGVRDEHYRERRADVERILPILAQAVRDEEREKAAQIADDFAVEVNNRAISDDLVSWASAQGKVRAAQEVSARIRAQGKEQDRG